MAQISFCCLAPGPPLKMLYSPAYFWFDKRPKYVVEIIPGGFYV
jgi:hypothetical protein